MFRDSELLLNHLFMFTIFLFMLLTNLLGSDVVTIILVSSANMTGLTEITIV